MPNNISPVNSSASKPLESETGSTAAIKSTFTGASSKVVSEVNHGQSGLNSSPGLSLKNLGIRDAKQAADAKASGDTDSSSAAQPAKVPAWKLKREAQNAARQELLNQDKQNLDNKVASANEIDGVEATEEEIQGVFDEVKNTLKEYKDRASALTELLRRNAAAGSFMAFIGADPGKMDSLLKFEQKALTGSSDQKIRQLRLGKLIPHFSPEQIKEAIKHSGFQSLMGDSISGEPGGYSKTIMDSLSVPQFEVFVSAVEDRDQALGMMKMVEKLDLDSPDLGGKLRAILSNFNGFSADVKSVVVSGESFISPKIRHVSDDGMKKELNDLLPDLKKWVLQNK